MVLIMTGSINCYFVQLVYKKQFLKKVVKVVLNITSIPLK